jgi:protein unc-45
MHPADDDAMVARRASAVLKRGAVTALVSLTKDKAGKRANVGEAMASILLHLATDTANRGAMVAQGAAAVLLPLANHGTAAGTAAAAQALAKLAITMDPALAFKGEKSAELIRPLVKLLQSEDGLQNFEALLALTNLSSSSEELQERLLLEGGLREIETHMFSDNTLIKRAATEAFCNLSQHPDVVAKCEQTTSGDRVRVLLALADMPDFATRRAASGSLAILTSDSAVLCRQVLAEKHGLPILVTLLNDASHALLPPPERAAARTAAAAAAAAADAAAGDDGGPPDPPPELSPDEARELQHRAMTILRNMADVPDVAKGIVAAGLLPVVEMLQFAAHPPVAAAAKAAFESLSAAA